MSLKARLTRLATIASDRPPATDERPFAHSHRWLGVMELLLQGIEEETPCEARRQLEAELKESIELLRGYIADPRIGAHVEYHCHGKMLEVAWWHHGMRDSFDVVDEAKRLRQSMQIDISRSK
jgi:hypothetical protein